MKPTFTIEKVGPELATLWLEKNTKNRTVIKRSLEQLTHEMKKDNFLFTGDSIKFDTNGNLLDGQHRLYAIKESGKEIEILVGRGLDPDVLAVLDTGRSRKAADVLSIEGYANAMRIAGVARFVIAFSASKYGLAAGSSGSSTIKNKFITNSDILDFVTRHEVELLEALSYGYNKNNKFVNGRFLSGCFYMFNKISPLHADEFCHKLVEGADLKSGSPITVLRQVLINDLRSTKKLSRIQILAFICKAWNAFRQNKTIQILKWDSMKEPFPKPI